MGSSVGVGPQGRSPYPQYPPPPARTTGGKLALLALSLWPVLYLGVLLLWFLSTFSGWGDWAPPGGFVFGGHCTTMLLSLGLQGWYIYAVVKHPLLDQTMRLVWILVLFQFNVLAMPVYWYLHVWRAPGEQLAGR